MLRPWLAVMNIALCMVAIAFETIVLVVYLSFLGLEILGIFACIVMIVGSIVGICTIKEDLGLETRKGIFLADFVFSLIVIMIAAGILTFTTLAFSVYVFIVVFFGSLPYVETVMAFFGITVLPWLGLVVMKGAVMFVYLMILVISIVGAIMNRRHKHRTEV